MKVVYNWLKDFVDVTASPDDLASRLALSGTNIGGVEKGAHGAVIDAEVSSNRPDCLSPLRDRARSQRGVQAAAESGASAEARRNRHAAKASDAVQRRNPVAGTCAGASPRA